MSTTRLVIGKASLTDFCVYLKQVDDAARVYRTMEIAEFKRREEAEAFVAGFRALLTLARPSKMHLEW